jgi:putative ABC transport system substrate-binding protein
MQHLKRRELMWLLGGAASSVSWPLAVRAAPAARVRHIGILVGTADDAQGRGLAAVFSGGLQRRGWFDGQNVQLEYRWASGQADLVRKYAAELVSIQPDVIMCTSTPTLIALRNETRTVPIVFVMVSDPVGLGQVASMARPGGNVTGFMPFEPSLGGKWVGLLKEIDPRVTRVVLVFNPDTAANAPAFVQHADAAGSALRVSVISAPVRSDPEIERAIADFAQQPGGGVVVLSDPYTFARRQPIVAATVRHHLPVIAPFRDFIAAGATVSYGIDVVDEFIRAAGYVDRILRGEKPGELPIQQPTRYELAINLKSAKALGLEIPPALLGRADEVVE